MDIHFLKNLKLTETIETPKKHLNFFLREGTDIMLNKVNKKVIFSTSILEKFKDKGIDFIDSSKWSNYPKDSTRILLFGFIDPIIKKEEKEYKQPKLDIIYLNKTELLNKTSCEKLVNLCSEIFSEDMWNENNLELKLHTEIPLKTENGIYNVPKVISRGEDKGKDTYIRREYINGVYPLTAIDPNITVSTEEINEIKEELVQEEDVKVTSENIKEVESILNEVKQ